MMKKEAGQAFILVLILLVIGALLVVPALRLSYTELKVSRLISGKTEKLYVLNAAQEWMLWNLTHPSFIDTFKIGEPQEFQIDVCDTPVTITVVMQAKPGQGGVSLAADQFIKPTKTVAVEGHPDWSTPDDGGVQVDNSYTGNYTYTITLDQLSENTTHGLDADYDVLLMGLSYVPNSSHIRVDGGEWEDFPEPDIYIVEGEGEEKDQHRLRWPASGNFTEPMRKFYVRQVKKIKFTVTGELEPKGATFYNWVLLKLGGIDTLSGPQAPIMVGNGARHVGGLLEVSKESLPQIIQPGIETSILYTISVTNIDGSTHQIQSLTDYLPPGFEYCTTQPDPEVPPQPEPFAVTHEACELPSGDIATSNPEIVKMTFDTPEEEDDRYRLHWEFSPAVDILAGETLTMNFWARTTKDVSGAYFNEVSVEPNAPVDIIFQPDDMSVTKADFNTTYSWTTGAVMVPYFDSEAEADGESIDTNFALSGGGVEISSWQIK